MVRAFAFSVVLHRVAAAVARGGQPVGLVIINNKEDAAARPCDGVDPVHHGDAVENGGGDGDDRDTNHAPEGQHGDHGDDGTAGAAHDCCQAMGKRQQAIEQRAGMHLLDAEGDGRRLLRKGPDEKGGQPVQQQPDDLRDDDRAEDAEPGALPGALQLPGAQVLPDKGGDGRRKAGDGQKGEALYLAVGTAATHGHFAVGVDIGLHHHIGQCDHRVLQAAGQAVGQNHAGHFGVKADLPPLHPVLPGCCAHQPAHAQEHADELRNNGGQRSAVHIHFEHADEQDIQHHIGDGGDDEIVKRVAAIPHRLHDAPALVIHHQADAARKVGTDIADRLRHDILRGAHPLKDLRGEEHPHDGEENARSQTEGDIGMDGRAHFFDLTGAEVAGDHHACAHRDAAEEADQQEDEGAGAGNGGEGAVAQHIADDEGIGGIIELLEQKAQEQRHRKGDQLLADGAFCHADFGFCHSAVISFSFSLHARGVLGANLL